MISDEALRAALQRYWGYSSFRPLQERIVKSLIAGRDTCVVMPTGGGKSLCYQLPAAMMPDKTVIVISPLIALMQDQMAQLSQMGIPAGTLNSVMSPAEQNKIMLAAAQGQFRLLYLSPERLARPDSIDWLKRVPVSLFAIDEAHCISEWGHEFRPDYRQLSALRKHFPECPIAAFTASATRQVRHDIIDQLRLKNPDKYIASFHRPNLRYIVKKCEYGTQFDLLVRALRQYDGSNVIVYAPTIKRVEQTVDMLEERGIEAIAYHGQMDKDARRRNQDRWTSDEVRVLVGTIAFGLGINKASVRAVIHLSLPKSIEQYYQEAGRAGRDGDPADCLLLWQAQDLGLLTYFIKKIEDHAEKERAWQRYHQVQDFAVDSKCRHWQICKHFGETPKWESCGGCDVCGATPEWIHFADAPPQKRNTLVATGKMNGSPKKIAPVGEIDPELSDYLREWRRSTAREQGIAAFVVMHDSTLDNVCRALPKTLDDIRRLPGFGERKTELYGQELLDAIQRFRQGARAIAVEKNHSRPADETARLLAKGHTLAEIAQIRGRQIGSVVSLVAEMVERGETEFQSSWIEDGKLPQIEKACSKLGTERLRPIKDALPESISFDDLRLVVAKLRRHAYLKAANA